MPLWVLRPVIPAPPSQPIRWAALRMPTASMRDFMANGGRRLRFLLAPAFPDRLPALRFGCVICDHDRSSGRECRANCLRHLQIKNWTSALACGCNRQPEGDPPQPGADGALISFGDRGLGPDLALSMETVRYLGWRANGRCELRRTEADSDAWRSALENKGRAAKICVTTRTTIDVHVTAPSAFGANQTPSKQGCRVRLHPQAEVCKQCSE